MYFTCQNMPSDVNLANHVYDHIDTLNKFYNVKKRIRASPYASQLAMTSSYRSQILFLVTLRTIILLNNSIQYQLTIYVMRSITIHFMFNLKLY